MKKFSSIQDLTKLITICHILMPTIIFHPIYHQHRLHNFGYFLIKTRTFLQKAILTWVGRRSLNMTFNTDGSTPIRQRPYRTAPAQRDEITKHIYTMLEADIIEPSTSPWASPVVLVKKKDGSTLFCVDYRKLNAITKKDSYPRSHIQESLDLLVKTQFFTTLDLFSGYWPVQMADASKEFTAFTTYEGLYQLKVLPFGICNAPSTFQRLTECVLRGLIW